MSIRPFLFAETDVHLWGLSSRQRLERTLAKMGVTDWTPDPAAVGEGDTVLLLRGDRLYDPRLVQALVSRPGTVLTDSREEGAQPVAAHVEPTLAGAVLDLLKGERPGDLPGGLVFEDPLGLAPTYLQTLRKLDVPYLLPICEEDRQMLEKRLFAGSYKGVTDLVTKWLWPLPARWATGFCVRHGIRPNHVTSLSLVLTVLAYFLFLHGHFALGLAAAWFMTFLDTVDGKLARVTVTYTAFGNIFDHAIDLFSPPFWYIAWGLGLAGGIPILPLKAAFYLILFGYVAGRVAEGIFKKFLEPSGIFSWRPVDSFFRLVTGRRNPNLVLLTLFLALGRPDAGLLAVTVWTVLSSLFLLVRLFQGWKSSREEGPLRSWFLDVDPEDPHPSLAQRVFTVRG